MPVNRTCKYSPCFKDVPQLLAVENWNKIRRRFFFFFFSNPIVLHKGALAIITLPSLHIARVNYVMQTCLGQVMEQVTSLGQAGRHWPFFFFFFNFSSPHFSFSDFTFNICHIPYRSFGRVTGVKVGEKQLVQKRRDIYSIFLKFLWRKFASRMLL